ncbi:MAG: amino acid ABC transporter permease [Devosiaceae bacterium]|nr:amino acid ABC transporter permease [Devosiaceae bacterium]
MADLRNNHNLAPKPSFFNDPKVRSIFYQLVVMAIIIAFVYVVATNTAANLAAQNKSTGFDFFLQPASFDINFTLIPFDRTSYYWEAFVVGMLNTLLVSVIGVIFATLLGFMLGIARLSNNWIIAKLAMVYVEIIRNVPLLLQLFFWYTVVLKAMPGVKNSFEWFGGFVLNNRGFSFPKPMPDETFNLVFIAFFIAVIGAFALKYWARKRLEQTGNRFPVFWASIGLLIAFPVVVWLISGANLAFETPELKGFNYKGGLTLPSEFLALLFGLIIYTTAFIAEIVRSGIVAVDKGQTEAAQSLGLKDGDRLRLVIIPQAMRVIIPPLTSQFLNLTKNSSLAAAIGYPDLVSVFMQTTLNQTGRAVEIVFITMMVYLTLSLITSVFMNWYNARVAMVER